jgi:hypothetical protein
LCYRLGDTHHSVTLIDGSGTAGTNICTCCFVYGAVHGCTTTTITTTANRCTFSGVAELMVNEWQASQVLHLNILSRVRKSKIQR